MARSPLSSRGFGRANLRVVQSAPEFGEDNDIIIDVDPSEDDDSPQINEDGKILSIEHGDGSVTISMNDKPLIGGPGHNRGGWFDNLADEIEDQQLGTIAEDLLRGIDDDIESRREWVEAVATFIKLLGVKVEVPGLQGAIDGAPVEGQSKVRHPLLLEAVLRFQANSRAELLPTDGPIKTRDDSADGTQTALLANALEQDLNHYLTAHATEYYPDTDRMYFRLGLAGTSFKKLYRCPLRMRPVSETVIAEDLIVSNDATDLANARRVTHRITMTPATVKRMQIIGAYREVDLNTPIAPDLDAAQREARAQQGVAEDVQNPEDRNRHIYECYCDLDIAGYEHQWKGRPSGLEIPYRVTIDVTSRQILSLVRDYNPLQSDSELPKRRKTFVKYSYVPSSLGFYDIGLGHILSNTANAITAAWREMLDNGMFANFPGFLIAKGSTRQNTSIIRVPPGGGQPIDTLGKPINQAVMPLPYNTTQMPALMQLVEAMATTGARIGGTAEIQVGEGKQDAPVGTTIALIEQATKIEGSVFKRLHASQAEEFQLLVELFREHPEDFLERECPSGQAWDEQTFIAALSTCKIVPQADPNTASHLQRAMKAMGIKQLQAQSQSLYDPIAVDTFVLKMMGINDPSQFFVPPAAMAQPPPQLQEIQAKMKAQQQAADAKTTEAQARMHTAQAKSAELQAKIAQGGFAKANNQPTHLDAIETKVKVEDAKTRRMDAETRQQDLIDKAHEIAIQSHDRTLDRVAEARSDHVDLIKAILAHHVEGREQMADQAHEARENALDRAADVRQAEADARAAENDKGGNSD